MLHTQRLSAGLQAPRCRHQQVPLAGPGQPASAPECSTSGRSQPCQSHGSVRGSQRWVPAAVATPTRPTGSLSGSMLGSVDMTEDERDDLKNSPNANFCVVIAGAGIGGLVLAVSLLKRGFSVKVLERDLTAIRGEGKYRGPIQVQSNALAALEAIDGTVAKRVLEAGCVTGDRVNGLCDGVTGKWYCKFDTYHPAVDRGLPVTRVISRTLLQKILAEAAMDLAGKDVIQNGCNVVRYREEKLGGGKKRIIAVCQDGQEISGDMLVGADGIRSKVRNELVGETIANYSQYTCYTGIADFLPPDIDTVGYRVFLGNGQYFVSSDVGGGKMQWYGFHKEAAGGSDPEGTQKDRLLDIFGHWTDMVTDLIKATPENDVIRRDIFDRPPIFKWTEGRVALLGDSAHAMQPNLGQGGCMAIEDAYQLGKDLFEEADRSRSAAKVLDPEPVLKGWVRKRLLRVSAVHGLAGMAAIMASTYKAYLGEGLGPLSWIQKFKIPHPGRVAGYVAMSLTMPTMLGWVLGGNIQNLSTNDRLPYCNLSDKPKAFEEKQFKIFMADDQALLHAARAHWVLVPAAAARKRGDLDEIDSCDVAGGGDAGCNDAFLRIALPEGSVQLSSGEVHVGSDPNSNVHVDCSQVGSKHARFSARGRDVYLTDLGTQHGTVLNDRPLQPGKEVRLAPGDHLLFGKSGHEHTEFFVKMCHNKVWDALVNQEASPVHNEEKVASEKAAPLVPA